MCGYSYIDLFLLHLLELYLVTICTLYYIVKIIIVNILRKEKEYFNVLHYFYTSREFAVE